MLCSISSNKLVSFLLCVAVSCCEVKGFFHYIAKPGPQVLATKGGVWPRPQNVTTEENYFIVRPHSFSFQTLGRVNCPDLLADAFTRYWNIISNAASLDRRGRFPEIKQRERNYLYRQQKKYNKLADEDNFVGNLDSLFVTLSGNCSEDIKPEFGDEENYTLILNSEEPSLTAPTIWGILRGLETFSQLIYFQDDTLLVNATRIEDFPRFSHRGLLLDTARHFIPVYAILETLDAMAYNKLNVFHWHIVDDQSFPYRSRVYPRLSDEGAFHPVSKVYEQVDIQRVIEHARLRGIRVIPEFDTPGHTRSWGVAYPELLSACFNASQPTGILGAMDPSNENTFTFIRNLFSEVVDVFPDSYFHIGGDEVDFYCWMTNPTVNKFMEDNSLKTYEQLESYFIQKVVEILDDLSSKYVVWEEVFVNGVEIPKSTLVHVWRDDGLKTLETVTESGYYALYSSCWYLDHLETGGDWQKYYNCEPLHFNGTQEQKDLVLGGEACMWSESVNENNLASRVWPRASAAAEKLWSAIEVVDIQDAERRIEEHTCRMNHRGIAAQPPNGPGVCL